MAVTVSRGDDTSAPPGGWPTPRSAYLHVPFCRHRCGYCNFSVVADRDAWMERYLQAIDLELAALEKPAVATLFVGGGTPTHLPAPYLRRLFDIIEERFAFEEDLEYSVEANPEDISRETLEILVAHGVNRISLGVQSFDSAKLKVLERGHDGGKARRGIELAAEAIPNLSIDLIFGAPDETLAVWERDLETVFSLPVRHLSTYALTFEKGTSFWSRRYHGEFHDMDEGTEVMMYQAAREQAAKAGFQHYEVSNFARPSFRCQHNMSYWRGEGWYAAGPGAARFVDGRREVNHRSTSTYLRRMETGRTPASESESITREQYARERAAFGVRLLDGFELNEFLVATGVDLEQLCGKAIAQSKQDGLLECTGTKLRLTERGVLFADTVASRFLDSE